jgi:hypothetical protein
MVAETATTQWALKGTVLIACNCDFGCPCNFNALPSHGFCEGGWTWHINEGRSATPSSMVRTGRQASAVRS